MGLPAAAAAAAAWIKIKGKFLLFLLLLLIPTDCIGAGGTRVSLVVLVPVHLLLEVVVVVMTTMAVHLDLPPATVLDPAAATAVRTESVVTTTT